ncbi:aluminum-activated malate transporter 12-like [Magnolia sinica]|uniref:aluminum-activated malate transporter 12-like n=1 Tax=Magnolia sinica TaxID=86752 RepID=UPI0026587993|nr:aluminum-activated malate transporter 12-like [Magnolia sinica]
MLPINSQDSTHSIEMPNIRDEEDPVNKKYSSLLSLIIQSRLLRRIRIEDSRKLIHSIKVGFALVLVSLLYFLQPLFQQVGDNAMWAIMTVVVVFEFTAGATLSKGINRGVGTIIGGGLGCVAALIAQKIGGISRAITISTSVFVFGALASYSRLVPSIKRKFDYGAMIFILTFNLVAVSCPRGEEIIKIAGDRLSTIGIGFAICVFTSVFIFPIWAGDELHRSLVSKFDNIALSIEVCLKEYFKPLDLKTETHASAGISSYKSMLHTRPADEMMTNFAKWEPWHGKFGFSYPWDKYLRLGELLRELAACVLSLEGCMHSHRQSPPSLKLAIKEPCEAMGKLLSFSLRELSDDIFNMHQCLPWGLIAAKLRLMRLELISAISVSNLRTPENGNGTTDDALPIASFAFILMQMVDKVEALAKEVEELGDLAGSLIH